MVNFSSIAARIGRPRRGPYSAAKAGIEALTRTLAVEWAPHGVRVNAVVPGIINTRLVQDNIAKGLADRDSLVRSIPLRRMGEAAELAEVVAFLLSEKAATSPASPSSSMVARPPTATGSPARGFERKIMARLRVHIDQDKCVAAGQCVFAAPDVFDQREEDGIVILLDEEPDEALTVSVRKAAKLCPALAITLEEI